MASDCDDYAKYWISRGFSSQPYDFEAPLNSKFQLGFARKPVIDLSVDTPIVSLYRAKLLDERPRIDKDTRALSFCNSRVLDVVLHRQAILVSDPFELPQRVIGFLEDGQPLRKLSALEHFLLAEFYDDEKMVLDHYSQAAEDNDLRRESLHRRMNIYLQSGQLTHAQSILDELETLKPWSMDTYRIAAYVYKRNGYLAKARDCFRSANKSFN